VVRVLEGGNNQPAKVVIAKQNLNFLAVKGESSSGVVVGADFVVLGANFFCKKEETNGCSLGKQIIQTG
jgi:hypothetical protein